MTGRFVEYFSFLLAIMLAALGYTADNVKWYEWLDYERLAWILYGTAGFLLLVSFRESMLRDEAKRTQELQERTELEALRSELAQLKANAHGEPHVGLVRPAEAAADDREGADQT